ncbi:uncharacterized protein LOC117299617 [Asterias rubens]|uniref:uncharacterized protein LOC117299617 n=1 Tax=Asterias rubens TaxID=7604 RepID=UPI001455D59C|nr:uncharacterized protein LOC117299617 [Asterias rubens]
MDSYDDYLPCYIKSERDGSATTMLLGLSSSECPREIGDHSGFVASNTKIKQNRERDLIMEQKKDFTNLNAADLQQDSKGKNDEKDEPKILSVADIYERLSGIMYNHNSTALDFSSWKICQTIHAETVKYGIADKTRLKPRSVRCSLPPTPRTVNSAVIKLITRSSTSPFKLRTSLSSKSDTHRPRSENSRSASCNPGKEEVGAWQEPPPPQPIHYSFKYLKHSRQYSDQYRENYTYDKIRDKHHSRSGVITGVVPPRARVRCVTKTKKNHGKSGPSSPISLAVETNKTSAIKWHINHQLLETCDLALSVNNPSPTEIAMLSRIPSVHRSSPSIPSNTNGKYGGKGTDKPYPFQLNISADARTVTAPSAKKTARSIFSH